MALKRLELRAGKLARAVLSGVTAGNSRCLHGEQDIRMIKTKQKISGGFRTQIYAKHFVKIRGFISTMRKQGNNIIDTMSRIIINHEDYNLSPSG